NRNCKILIIKIFTPPGKDKMSNQVNFSNITLKTVDYCIYLGKDTKFVKGVYLSLSLLQN
ncbi:MAG: hypothetical protein KAG99_04450, partial [Bacteroidales bacterium]|nr:hypothetical protein [Bacteroidales bacterium]